jgi:hypothetical protein
LSNSTICGGSLVNPSFLRSSTRRDLNMVKNDGGRAGVGMVIRRVSVFMVSLRERSFDVVSIAGGLVSVRVCHRLPFGFLLGFEVGLPEDGEGLVD